MITLFKQILAFSLNTGIGKKYLKSKCLMGRYKKCDAREPNGVFILTGTRSNDLVVGCILSLSKFHIQPFPLIMAGHTIIERW